MPHRSSSFGQKAFAQVICGIFVFIFCIFPYQGSGQADVTVLDLSQQIKDRKVKIDNLRGRIKSYETTIQNRLKEKVSLENQIGLLKDRLEQKLLDIEATEDEIEQLSLELRQADLEILNTEDRITLEKSRIGVLLRSLYDENDRSYLEILLMNDRLSDFFDAIYGIEQLQESLRRTLEQFAELKNQLEVQRSSLKINKDRQEKLRAKLIGQKDEMEENQSAKQSLVVQSVLSAEKYQRLLQEARQEQQSIDAAIKRLEETLREKLKIHGGKGTVELAWPLEPTRGISAQFHDPGYPFRHIFEHPAIDIRAYQGTQIRAAEDGYVARVQFDGTPSYGYIMLIHEKGIATVYGHISRPIITQDTYVKKGQIIALSGATPRTPGAGRLTTGPHLHFEVRLNGIPVNPLKYLP